MLRATSQNKIFRHKTDVLVMGAGFAGIIAAISAAEAGAKVCLVSSGPICSGSSFYPGTWGFGLVGPKDREDEPDLEETIFRVGAEAADRRLIHTFVSGITESIRYLEYLGVPLMRAQNSGQREFIPCFDHACRSWHGIVKEKARPVLLEQMKRLEIELFPFTEITELVKEEGRVSGALAIRGEDLPMLFSFRSMVLASGGLGGLFAHHLTPGDITGKGQYLALEAGARLVNTEFLQMMPGFLEPAYGTVFNEKIFRYARSHAFDCFTKQEREALLELRSGHGPYTCRLKSGLIDEAVMEAWEAEQRGALVIYDPAIKEHQPEFVKTYFEWLEREKGLTMDDPVRIGIFAHASNGGIYIDEAGFTGVPGLFACGECTGGMHGADRLGGLSTANGLVFGRAAGSAAALDARQQECREVAGRRKWKEPEEETDYEFRRARSIRKELKKRMSHCAMIARSEERCTEMLDWMKQGGVEWNQDLERKFSPKTYLELTRMESELTAAGCMVAAIRMRKESRGSHHRTDYLQKDPGMSRMLAVSECEGETTCRWIEEQEEGKRWKAIF